MPIASNANNIRFNGTGRLYAADASAPESQLGMEIGEIDGLTDSMTSTEEEIVSNRNAGNAVIATVNSEIKGTLKFGARESSVENLQMAYSADPADSTSQLAGTIDAVETTLVEKEYVDVGKSDCYYHKVGIGTVTGGPFVAGETVTQGAITGKVAWVGSGYLEIIGLSGTLVAGTAIVGGTSSASAPVSSQEKMTDMVVTDDDTTPTVRYTLETDYRVDADYGFIMKMPGSTIGDTAFVSASYPAVSKKSLYPMSAPGAVKRLTFVSDANDRGPRMKYTYFRVAIAQDGDSQKIGKGEAVNSIAGTLMADTTKPAGKQFMRIDIFGE